MTEHEQPRGQAPEPRPSDIGYSGHGIRLGYGTMRQLLLEALAETPRHGYDLIRHLSEGFGTGYRPSAGAIYPRLAKLTQEGLLTRHRVGRTVVYALTDDGRAAVENGPPRLPRTVRAIESPDPNTALEESLDALETFCRGVATDLRKHASLGRLIVSQDLKSHLDETRNIITHLLTSPQAPHALASQEPSPQ